MPNLLTDRQVAFEGASTQLRFCADAERRWASGQYCFQQARWAFCIDARAWASDSDATFARAMSIARLLTVALRLPPSIAETTVTDGLARVQREGGPIPAPGPCSVILPSPMTFEAIATFTAHPAMCRHH
ncbi:hypothetical protein [Streptomyces sp. NPDC002403]